MNQPSNSSSMSHLKQISTSGNVVDLDSYFHNDTYLTDIDPDEHTYYTKKCVEVVVFTAIECGHIHVLDWCMQNGYFG